ncbi:unnamed protein product [Sphagnum troendelagicum]|uniref:ATP synthase F0 subunit 8 n=1 Tax=Sphagnum troendelagicum TaxID=128251 RepID=A0ABP0TEB7_9BRYO
MDYLFIQASMSTTHNNCSFAWIVAPLVGIVGFLTCLWILKLITSEKRKKKKKKKKKKHVASKLPPGPKAEAAHEFLKVQDKVWSSRPPSIATRLISYNYKGICIDTLWASLASHAQDLSLGAFQHQAY